MATDHVNRWDLISPVQEAIIEKLSQNTVVFPLVNITIGVKLDRSNFLIWKQKILILMVVYGPEDYIDGAKKMSVKFLEFGILNSKYSILRRLYGTLRSWLYSSIILQWTHT